MTALLRPIELARLRTNGRLTADRMARGLERACTAPVKRVRCRDGREWLLFEIDPDDGDLAFAECRRPGREPERLWLRMSWLERQVAATTHYGRVRRAAA